MRRYFILVLGFFALGVGLWAVFPPLCGLCAARSADEGVVNELAEYGVESLGALEEHSGTNQPLRGIHAVG